MCWDDFTAENVINTIPLHKTHHYKEHNDTCNLSHWGLAHQSVPQEEVIDNFMSQHVSTCLSLHSLAVCDWAHMLTVFVVINFFMPTLCWKYNEVLQPYLKHSGIVTKN